MRHKMKAPNKLFMNFPHDYWHVVESEKTANDIEYIRKDALLEWMKEQEEIMKCGGRILISDIISRIESL